MTWKVVLRPRARIDIAQSVDWYDGLVPGLGGEFLIEVRRGLEMITHNPYQYQAIRGAIRRIVIRRFSHLLLYAVEGDEIIIARCVHGRRDPRRWMQRT